MADLPARSNHQPQAIDCQAINKSRLSTGGFHVTDVRFTPARPEQEATGFLGLIRFTVNDGLGVDGIALRRNTGGELYISYPSRVDRSGQRHPLVRPLGDGPRREIEDQVFRALGLAESSR